MATILSHDDAAFDLSVAPGCLPNGILVDVELQPESGRCLIFGRLANGNTGSVEIKGGHSQVSLPFIDPRIFIKHLGRFQEIRIGTIGHKNI